MSVKMISKKTLSQIGEFGVIEQIAKIVKTPKNVIKGIGDDTAVLPCSADKYLLLTTDMLVEDVHFKKNMGARLIGRKALACSISDVAAMGGVPTYAVVSLGVPPNLSVDFVEKIYKGMAALANRFKIGIVGGDTVSSEKIVINVALLGEAQKRRIVFRSGAKKGNKIFVTGPLGRSLQTGRHLNFTPRLKEARYLVKNFRPTSMIDISDGLAGDLGHIVRASGVGAVIYEDLIPRNSRAALKEALYDGEDFELIFTLSYKEANRLMRSKVKPFIYIGDIIKGKGQIVLMDKNGRLKAVSPRSFTHF